MSKRKFYRTVYQVEVLSEEPYCIDPDEENVLEQVGYDITEGHCSGDVVTLVDNEEIDGPAMAKLLRAQRSDPEFFDLTDEGEDIVDTALDDLDDTGVPEHGNADTTEET